MCDRDGPAHAAIKTIKAESSTFDREALVREAALTGALEHPGIVPVHAFGVDANGSPILMMKRVEGVSWSTILEDASHAAWSTHLGDPSDRIEAHVDILSAVCRAVELAHTRGVVHRDLKPSNIMVGAFGEVYVVDWGIAARIGATSGDPILGTPSYMAPEMALGLEVDERTDVYLLGATLHAVLEGRPRHDARSVFDAIRLAVQSAPFDYSSAVPAVLGALANRACSLLREDRPQSVRAFREELARWKKLRGALDLCLAGHLRVDRLEELLRASVDRAPADLAHAYRLVAEARFAFRQAAEQAPELVEAVAGERAAIEAQVELALRQGQAETAGALLSECRDPAPALVARITAAKARTKLEYEERDRLRAVVRGLDPSIGRWARAMPLLVITIVSTIVTALVFADVVGRTTLGALGIHSLITVAAVAATVVKRKKIFGHPYNRRVWAFLALSMLAILVSRATAAATGCTLDRALTNDLLALASLHAAGAVALTPRLFVGTSVLLVGWMVAMAAPATSVLVFYATLLLAVSAATWSIATSGGSRVGRSP